VFFYIFSLIYYILLIIKIGSLHEATKARNILKTPKLKPQLRIQR